jgi:hypothetical protein
MMATSHLLTVLTVIFMVHGEVSSCTLNDLTKCQLILTTADKVGGGQIVMSAFTPKVDIARHHLDVR